MVHGVKKKMRRCTHWAEESRSEHEKRICFPVTSDARTVDITHIHKYSGHRKVPLGSYGPFFAKHVPFTSSIHPDFADDYVAERCKRITNGIYAGREN